MTLLIIFGYALMAFIASVIIRVIDLKTDSPLHNEEAYMLEGLIWPFFIPALIPMGLCSVMVHLSNYIYKNIHETKKTHE